MPLPVLPPGGISGLPFGAWARLLADNRFAVSPRYWLRAGVLTALSVWNSAAALVERAFVEGRARRLEVPPPVFVLGVWRSGTTHLHNLLSLDRRFAYPNLFEVLNPHTFLWTEGLLARLGGWFVPKKRRQDNVQLGLGLPAEDEMALCGLGLASFILSWVFPRRTAHYDRYLCLSELSAEERARWQAAFLLFVKKLTYRYSRPLLIKSPAHTGRIAALLELFPEARFVHIHRDPYTVFQSTRAASLKIMDDWALQAGGWPDLEARIVQQNREIYERFFAERKLIPAGRYCDVSYEALTADPARALEGVYGTLGLAGFEAARPAVQEYAAALAEYEPNTFEPLSSEQRRRIAEAWRPYFAEWGYAA